MKKMYTLEEAFSLVGSKGEAIKAEVRKAHSYLDVADIVEIEYSIDLAVDPARAARYLENEDTIVREAAVVSILAIAGGAQFG